MGRGRQPACLGAGLLGLALAGLPPLPAAAHAVLVEARPSDGARLEAPPAEIVLRFNEPVTPIAVRLIGAGGDAVEAAVEVRGETLRLRPAAPLARGAYLVSYRIASLDAHPVGASLRFGVGADPLAPGHETAAPAARWAAVLARWAAYALGLGGAGLALFLLAVRPPPAVTVRVLVLLVPLALAGAAASLLRLGATGLDLAGLPLRALASVEPWAAAAGTSLGAATLLAVGGCAALALAARRERRWACAVGALAVACALSLTGHAATAAPRWLTAPAVALHALAAAFWVGSFLPLRWSVGALPPAEAGVVLRRFSAWASAAVVALAAAGALLAWVQLGGRPEALRGTAYGRLLAAKLALVALLLLLAALHRWRLTPALAAGEVAAARRLRRTLAADLALGLAVLAATAAFPLTPPPRATAAGEEAGGTSIVVAGPAHQAVLTLRPGRVGTNRLEAWVTDATGVPVAAREAAVALSLPAAGIEPARVPVAAPRPGVYAADGLVAPVAGRWRLRLDLLVDDFTKVTLEGEVALR